MTVASPARAHTATLVVVGPSERLAEAAGILGAIDQAGGVRGVLISTDASSAPAPAEQDDIVSIAGLKAEYVDNAIAALRLSSLPTVVWWRGGQPARLDGVAALADRIILDVEDAAPLWSRAPGLFDRVAITDLRWARLTRWRAVMAHFFDLPQVREAADAFTHLRISGSDRAECTLFAGWLDASLGWEGRVAVEMTDAGATASMTSVTLTGPTADLSMHRRQNRACLETRARVNDHVMASRVVSAGDQRLPALLSEELRVRSRDLAFERALTSTAFLGL